MVTDSLSAKRVIQGLPRARNAGNGPVSGSPSLTLAPHRTILATGSAIDRTSDNAEAASSCCRPKDRSHRTASATPHYVQSDTNVTPK